MLRTLKFNRRWAAKLEKQKAKRLAREQAKKEREAAAAQAKREQEERSKVNPFSAGAGAAGAGLGGMLFGGGSDNPFAAPAAAPATATETADKDNENEDDEDEDDESEEDEEESESERLAEELALKSDLAATTPSAESAWVESSTKYPALYLNTVPEPSSSSVSKKLSKEEVAVLKSASASGALAQNDMDDAELKGFANEGYEKMLLDGIDDTFERFLKRVSVEPRQAVRYEFGGEPVPFHAKGKIYDLLWPKEPKLKAGDGVAVTKSQFKSGASAQNGAERAFSVRAVPPCPHCGGERVFEAQLMPNLINLLKAEQIQAADGSLDTDASNANTLRRATRKPSAKQPSNRHWVDVCPLPTTSRQRMAVRRRSMPGQASFGAPPLCLSAKTTAAPLGTSAGARRSSSLSLRTSRNRFLSCRGSASSLCIFTICTPHQHSRQHLLY